MIIHLRLMRLLTVILLLLHVMAGTGVVVVAVPDNPSSQPSGSPSNQPTFQPTHQPTRLPSVQPSGYPSVQPTVQPTKQPSIQPSSSPSHMPTQQPSDQPSKQPSSKPTQQPTIQPSVSPSSVPTRQPSRQPSTQPSSMPSCVPSAQPSDQPSLTPSSQPTRLPSMQPTGAPSRIPTRQPTRNPTRQPTGTPTVIPTMQPSAQPSSQPSGRPSMQPTDAPSKQPTCVPSRQPTKQPSAQPTGAPSRTPTNQPSKQPSVQPTGNPTYQPFAEPSMQPSRQPTRQPSRQPSHQPTGQPSVRPSLQPSRQPSSQPSGQPSLTPTRQPTRQPTVQPTGKPSFQPTGQPSRQPFAVPTGCPTTVPTMQPSRQPSLTPTRQPTRQPTVQPTGTPSVQPTIQPSRQPFDQPTSRPTMIPTNQPSGQPSRRPSRQPTRVPSIQPSGSPSVQPTSQPSRAPSVQPTTQPSKQPSARPSMQPTAAPSKQPSQQPSMRPTGQPSRVPTLQPSQLPTTQPSTTPTTFPTMQPTGQPNMRPSTQPSRQPTSAPSCAPTTIPTSEPSHPTPLPTSQPTRMPTKLSTKYPTSQPSMVPTLQPSVEPSMQPSNQPTGEPSSQPSIQPTSHPSQQPFSPPTGQPSATPTTEPSYQPLSPPTRQPSSHPSIQPSTQPSSCPSQPSSQPSACPSMQPSAQPSSIPTAPTGQPSSHPSSLPSAQPLMIPTCQPTVQPSSHPSFQPFAAPSMQPTSQPSVEPSIQPSVVPSIRPSTQPSIRPSMQPTSQPSSEPSLQPSIAPTAQPSTQPSSEPTSSPTSQATLAPTVQPSVAPSMQPSTQPSSEPTSQPSSAPSMQPSVSPTQQPSSHPSSQPSVEPSAQPSASPSTQPSAQPSSIPSQQPSVQPSAIPSTQPSSHPSSEPSCQPTTQPSGAPSAQPSSIPSRQPSIQPSITPTTQPSMQPTVDPSMQPSCMPSAQPSVQPTCEPTIQPSSSPTTRPSVQPSVAPTMQPSVQPTSQPTTQPSSDPSSQPSSQPSTQPSHTPSEFPTLQPTCNPSQQPSGQPTVQPSSQPSNEPSVEPSIHPSEQPSGTPTAQPSITPTSQPSVQPSSQPSSMPTKQPSAQPTSQPTAEPTIQPSSIPSLRPSSQPSSVPSIQPSVKPTVQPSAQPSREPTNQPSTQPSSEPSEQPTEAPSSQPSVQPTVEPSAQPSSQPSAVPTQQPSVSPTHQPSSQPTVVPSQQPTSHPTSQPSSQPSVEPSCQPTIQPSLAPLNEPTSQPSVHPSTQPSRRPTRQPTMQPSVEPSQQPAVAPSAQPSTQPSITPSQQPSSSPSHLPSTQPTVLPSQQPTAQPSVEPSTQPASVPSMQPSSMPSMQPSSEPTQPTSQPSAQPSSRPTMQPSAQPSMDPTQQPTSLPSCQPSQQPSSVPSHQPTENPTTHPSGQPFSKPSTQPTTQPSIEPTMQPSSRPSMQPSSQPSSVPSVQPIVAPSSSPSFQPISVPSMQPTVQPSSEPSQQPFARPSGAPSKQPSAVPSMQPSSEPTQPTSQPSAQPSSRPSCEPSGQPSGQPTLTPGMPPTSQPTRIPSCQPSSEPTQPTSQPSTQPSTEPSVQPSTVPSCQPSSEPTQPTSQPSGLPTNEPSMKPSMQPSTQPTRIPTGQPTRVPTKQPSSSPSTLPTIQPSRQPTAQPSSEPSMKPSAQPTVQPSRQPTVQPSRVPSLQPSSNPSRLPTDQPTAQPTILPSSHPTTQPTVQPTMQPSKQPSGWPSKQPTAQPSAVPSQLPTTEPTDQPSMQPTFQPSRQPSVGPSSQPSWQPSVRPTAQPSGQPSSQPSWQPSVRPSAQPSSQPSLQPSVQPSMQPTGQPSRQPSQQPTAQPSVQPSGQPSRQPTAEPTNQPTRQPTSQPTCQPTAQPSRSPTMQPTAQPTDQPSRQPTQRPSLQPTVQPTVQPSKQPSVSPSQQPSVHPSIQPSRQPTSQPSGQPSVQPSLAPSSQPSSRPSAVPSSQPSNQPSAQPSSIPSVEPTSQPSFQPSVQPSAKPSMVPSVQPSNRPTAVPSCQPSKRPSLQPSAVPSCQPSARPTMEPSSNPSSQPSMRPSVQPSVQPSSRPSIDPSSIPSSQPSSVPSLQPSTKPSLQPTQQPSSVPSIQPSARPSSDPSSQPSAQPSATPSLEPSGQPTAQPSSEPTMRPSVQPSVQPTFMPTTQPTMVPSKTPSSQPSTRPSAQPSRFPSSEPSGQPSCEPTGQPTRQPSVQPSGQPTFVPTIQPSHQPTAQPSSQPMTIPTAQPTSQPTMEPSIQPSLQPSTIPSVQPSSRPSYVPTVQPSSLPSCSPTHQPSTSPSSQPSSEPTSPTGQPTSLPTQQPSSQPSSFPSTQPSVQPSIQPSAQPSTQPSSQPSAQPSMQPSLQPSGQPTVRPSTSRPTSYPSGGPTQPPVSSKPTYSGETNKPVRFPTSSPTWNILDYKSHATYITYSADLKEYSTIPDSFTTANYYYKGITYAGSCDQWDHLTQTSLNMPFLEKYYSQISVSFQNYDFDSKQFLNHSATCSNVDRVQEIVSHLQTGETLEANCGGNTWRVYQCSGATLLCVNCKRICVDSVICPGAQSLVVNPCASSVGRCDRDYHTAASAVANFAFSTGIYYPLFRQPPVLSATRERSIDVTVNISKSGNVYCAAFAEPYGNDEENSGISALASSADIRTSKFSNRGFVPYASRSFGGSTTVTIDSLSPSTEYSVVCYTEDFADHAMPLSDALGYKASISTVCCKALHFSGPEYIGVYTEGVGNTAGAEPVFTVLADPSSARRYNVTVPTKAVESRLRLKIIISSIQCRLTTVYTAGTVFPDSFEFVSSADQVLSSVLASAYTGFFTVRATGGCYNLIITGVTTHAYEDGRQVTEEYTHINTTVNVVSANTVRQVPVVATTARLSDDGRTVVVLFDNPTDRGATVLDDYMNPFNCSLVLRFPSNTLSTCEWTSSTQLSINVHSSEEGVIPGNNVTLLPKRIKPACPFTGSGASACGGYFYSLYTELTIEPPTKPMVPTAVITAPSLVSQCSELLLDYSGSAGAAGRSWESIEWHVFSDDKYGHGDQTAEDMKAYLSQRFTAGTTTGVASLPSYLYSSRYMVGLRFYFQIILTNWLMQSSSAIVVVTISDLNFLPVVRLLGTSPQSPDSFTNIVGGNIARFQPLFLTAFGSLSPCMTAAEAKQAILYTWSVYEGYTLRPDLVSTSADPRYFSLPPYTLTAQKNYTVQVTASVEAFVAETATTEATTGMYSSSDSVFLSVGYGGVSSRITGGDIQSAGRDKQYFTIDASQSVDMDVPGFSGTAAGLSFEWACEAYAAGVTAATMKVSLGVKADCPGFRQTANSAITVPIASTILIGTLTAQPEAYKVSVTVRNAMGLFDTSSIFVSIVSKSNAPLVVMDHQLDNSWGRYNAQDEIVLSAQVVSTTGAGSIGWSSTNFTIASTFLTLFSTPTSQVFQNGTTRCDLGILPNVLLPGLSYTFTLSATHQVSAATSFSTVTVSINQPPSGGTAAASPLLGTVLVTKFTFNAYNWMDSESDYPLKYGYTSYNLSPLDASRGIYVKYIDPVPYFTGYLPQGLLSAQYFTTLQLSVVDSWGGVATKDLSLKVSPSSADSTGLEIAYDKAYDAAMVVEDYTSVMQLIAATALAVESTTNCVVPTTCSILNREPCSKVPKTCGPCLDGYIGIDGASNVACNLESNFVKTGARCGADSKCISGNCDDELEICIEAIKTCPGDCSSGNGECITLDYYNNVISADDCPVSSYFCKTRCACSEGWYGDSCAFSEADNAVRTSLRESLCFSIAQTLNTQDVSPETVRTRMNAVSGALSDVSEVSLVALGNCTAAVIKTIENDGVDASESVICHRDVVDSVASALSALLSYYERDVLPGGAAGTNNEDWLEAQLVDINMGIRLLSATCQANAALNQDPKSVVAPRLKLLSSMNSVNELLGQYLPVPSRAPTRIPTMAPTNSTLNETLTRSMSSSSDASLRVADFHEEVRRLAAETLTPYGVIFSADGAYAVTLPVTAFESFEGVVGAQVRILAAADPAVYNLIAESSVATTMTELSFNPTTKDKMNSSVVSVRTVAVFEQGQVVRTLSPGAKSEISVTLRNIVPINYTEQEIVYIPVYCHSTREETYSFTVMCPYDFEVTVPCPAGAKGYYNISCPSFHERPKCLVLDQIEGRFLDNELCLATSYTQASTTCTCYSNVTEASSTDSASLSRIWSRRTVTSSSTTNSKYAPASDTLGTHGRTHSRLLAASAVGQEFILFDETLSAAVRVETTALDIQYTEYPPLEERFESGLVISVLTMMIVALVGLIVFGVYIFWYREVNKFIKSVKRDKVAVECDEKQQEWSIFAHKLPLELAAKKASGGRFSREIKPFIKSALPPELTPTLRPLSFYWTSLKREHMWLSWWFVKDTFGGAAVMSESDDSSGALLYMNIQMIILFGKVLSFLLLATVFSELFFFDDGTCEDIDVQNSCENLMVTLNLRNACEWNPSNQSCSFFTPQVDFITIFTFCALVVLLAQFVNRVLEAVFRRLLHRYMSNNSDAVVMTRTSEAKKTKKKHAITGAGQGFSSKSLRLSSKFVDNDSSKSNGDIGSEVGIQPQDEDQEAQEDQAVDEFTAVITQNGLVLRAARLIKFQQNTIFASPSNECVFLIKRTTAELSRIHSMLFENLAITFDPTKMYTRYEIIMFQLKFNPALRAVNRARHIEFILHDRMKEQEYSSDFAALQEKLMMQYFIVDLLPLQLQFIADSVIFHRHDIFPHPSNAKPPATVVSKKGGVATVSAVEGLDKDVDVHNNDSSEDHELNSTIGSVASNKPNNSSSNNSTRRSVGAASLKDQLANGFSKFRTLCNMWALDLVCAAYVALHFFGTVVYVFSTGLNIGTRSADMWFLTFVCAAAFDGVLVQGLSVYLKCCALTNGIVGGKATRIADLLCLRARLILLRKIGIMRDADCPIQHLNPACRAASHFPGLPVSRLLLSINDADVATVSKGTRIDEKKYLSVRTVYVLLVTFTSKMFNFGMIVLSHLPYAFFAAAIDIIAASILLAAVYMYYTIYFAVSGIVFAAFLLVSALLFATYFFAREQLKAIIMCCVGRGSDDAGNVGRARGRRHAPDTFDRYKADDSNTVGRGSGSHTVYAAITSMYKQHHSSMSSASINSTGTGGAGRSITSPNKVVPWGSPISSPSQKALSKKSFLHSSTAGELQDEAEGKDANSGANDSRSKSSKSLLLDRSSSGGGTASFHRGLSNVPSSPHTPTGGSLPKQYSAVLGLGAGVGVGVVQEGKDEEEDEDQDLDFDDESIATLEDPSHRPIPIPNSSSSSSSYNNNNNNSTSQSSLFPTKSMHSLRDFAHSGNPDGNNSNSNSSNKSHSYSLSVVHRQQSLGAIPSSSLSPPFFSPPTNATSATSVNGHVIDDDDDLSLVSRNSRHIRRTNSRRHQEYYNSTKQPHAVSPAVQRGDSRSNSNNDGVSTQLQQQSPHARSGLGPAPAWKSSRSLHIQQNSDVPLARSYDNNRHNTNPSDNNHGNQSPLQADISNFLNFRSSQEASSTMQPHILEFYSHRNRLQMLSPDGAAPDAVTDLAPGFTSSLSPILSPIGGSGSSAGRAGGGTGTVGSTHDLDNWSMQRHSIGSAVGRSRNHHSSGGGNSRGGGGGDGSVMTDFDDDDSYSVSAASNNYYSSPPLNRNSSNGSENGGGSVGGASYSSRRQAQRAARARSQQQQQQRRHQGDQSQQQEPDAYY